MTHAKASRPFLPALAAMGVMLALTAGSPPTRATSWYPMTVEELAGYAELIVLGRVVDAARDNTTLAVENVLKQPGDQRVEGKITAGWVCDTFGGNPDCVKVGERLIAFLVRSPDRPDFGWQCVQPLAAINIGDEKAVRIRTSRLAEETKTLSEVLAVIRDVLPPLELRLAPDRQQVGKRGGPARFRLTVRNASTRTVEILDPRSGALQVFAQVRRSPRDGWYGSLTPGEDTKARRRLKPGESVVVERASAHVEVAPGDRREKVPWPSDLSLVRFAVYPAPGTQPAASLWWSNSVLVGGAPD